MDESSRIAVQNWLLVKWHRGCPTCGAKTWEVNGWISTPILEETATDKINNLERVAVTCTTCLCTLLLGTSADFYFASPPRIEDLSREQQDLSREQQRGRSVLE
jgi:hypothetical protein